MGKLLSGIMGPVKGRVGNLVFTTWKGKNVVKSRPERKAEITENEKITNSTFGYTQKWLTPIAPFLKAGLSNVEGFESTLTARNIATSLLYRDALIKDGFNSRIDPSRITISAGRLPLADNLQLHFDAEKAEVKVTWDPKVPANAPGRELSSGDDQLMLLIYNPEERLVFGKVHGALRETGEQTCVLEPEDKGEYHVWVAFIAENRNSQSDSRYLGSITLG